MYDDIDWYEVLGIPPEATDDDIRQAWRLRVKEAHPDTNGATDAERTTKLINIAKDILLDKDKRLAFDLRRAKWKKREEETKRQEEARRRNQRKRERITREQILEIELIVERKLRREAEEKLRGMGWYELQQELQTEKQLREQAERKLRFEEEFNSFYEYLYEEQVMRAEQAEGRGRQDRQRAERAEERVEVLEDLMEDLQRNLDITFFENSVRHASLQTLRFSLRATADAVVYTLSRTLENQERGSRKSGV